MDTVLFEAFGAVITPWKVIGYLGVALFAGRWFVQLHASRARRRPTVPLLFWYMSILGSLLCLAYFIFGKNDSVGILSNAFPFLVAVYNLRLALRAKEGLEPPPRTSVNLRGESGEAGSPSG